LGVVFTRRCHSGVSEQCLIHPCPCCRFGEGFAISGGEQWRVRRKAVGPALHRCEFLVAQLICADTRTLQEPKVAAAAAAAAARQLRCTRLLIFAQGLPGGDAGPRVWRVGCPICSLVGAVSCLSIVQGLPGGHAGPCVWDRKSTRLNSSHITISYAVFCLKKKKKYKTSKAPNR